MIIGPLGGGIKRQMDVWVDNEDAEAGKVESRSTIEESRKIV